MSYTAPRSGYATGARPLTPRMLDVLRLAAAGRTLEATAAELGLAVSTVSNERAALCARLEAPNMAAAVLAAVRLGELR